MKTKQKMNAAVRKHAEHTLTDVVNYVNRQWGDGFDRLGKDQQQALIRAGMLAVIHRSKGLGDADTYRELTEAMTSAAMEWLETP